MPLYFFDTDDGDKRMSDDHGVDLADAQCARTEALAALPDIARDKLPNGDRRTFVTKIRDEEGHVIFVATLTLIAEWTDADAEKSGGSAFSRS